MGDFFTGNLLAALYTGLALTFLLGVVVGGVAVYIWHQLEKGKTDSRQEAHAG